MFIFSIVIAVLLVAALVYLGVLQLNTKKLHAYVATLERELAQVQTRVELKLAQFERRVEGKDKPAPANPPVDYPNAG